MKFQCKKSGCIVEFVYEHDIKAMLEHPDYIVYQEPVKTDKKVKE